MVTRKKFGCLRCFGASAEAAYEECKKFTAIARLVDESHFIMRIVSCPYCDQRYVSVFTEWVDWGDGEDPQFRSVLPITIHESERLLSQGENVNLRLIESLGKSRRYLAFDWPKDTEPAVYWAWGGLKIGPHD